MAKINIGVIKSLTYEIVERITRFTIHIEEIEKQFYLDDSNAKDKLEFIKSYKESLLKILNIAIVGYKEVNKLKNDDRTEEHFKILKTSLDAINNLHTEWLAILPRPSEPVELARFKRVIYKQIVQLNKKEEKQKEISISINEKIGEEISLDPLSKYKETINKLIKSYNKTSKEKIKELENSQTLKHYQTHITIPRIDASNTYRWSSLIHEMAHSLMTGVGFEHDTIENDFLNFVDNDKFIINYFKPRRSTRGFSPDKKTLHSWLVECWCDLFACILIGPSLYFSQYLAFLNEPKNYNDRHPPAIFRLYLLESILASRFPKKLFSQLENYISDCEELILALQDKNTVKLNKNSTLGRVSQNFKAYFKKHFFASGDGVFIKGNETLNNKLEGLVKKYVNLHPDVILHLVERLNQGLPIPSIKTRTDGNEYEEIPTYIQEIFLASWISRIDVLQKKILVAIDNYNDEDLILFYRNDIESPIKRHDQAVLKSIQVSEWFDFFNKEKERTEKIEVYKNKRKNSITKISGVLVDKEIKNLILSDELKIIPIMDLNAQTGTTSIDIRLGTSFQLFYPDQYGIIDFTNINSDNELKNYSKRVNLDFIEGITIIPGQFLLGHSMEYVKLPDYICGNLEGRSSFARLGVEIHMTAGFIDPGFEGVITFEIFNAGSTAVKLYPGMRIGQMRLEKNNIPDRLYSNKHTVKYKGLLEHNVSKQSKDIEVEILKNYNIKS